MVDIPLQKAVRHGVFETNSSSTHSISIVEGDFLVDHLPVDGDNVCRIPCGEFGWDVKDYSDAATKASYLATWLLQTESYLTYREEHPELYAQQPPDHGPTEDDEVNKVIRRLGVPALKQLLIDAVKLETGCDEVLFVGDPDASEYSDGQGYIDHQSDFVAAGAFVSADALRAFIFNPESVLHTDNDNH